MSDQARANITVRASIKAFRIPPVHDALVIGRQSPIGITALSKSVELIMNVPFTRLSFDGDEVIADVLVRSAILRRMPEERLRAFILEQIKPLLDVEEILHVDLHPEIVLEARV